MFKGKGKAAAATLAQLILIATAINNEILLLACYSIAAFKRFACIAKRSALAALVYYCYPAFKEEEEKYKEEEE